MRGDLVERRLSDHVLIAVVQPRHFSDHEHQWEREQGNGVEGISPRIGTPIRTAIPADATSASASARR